MARRITPSQFRSMVRQAEQKRKRAINDLNRGIRDYNRKVKQEVDRYNREVRAHNSRVRANRQRLKNEVARLNRQSSSTRYVTYRVSVQAMQTAYERLESAADQGRFDERYNELLDLSEREAANNAGLMNALLDDSAIDDDAPAPDEPASPVTPILQRLSADLCDRWRGALYSLSPQNPDAARHFCTSAREIVTQILDLHAPNHSVEEAIPDCERTQQGTPTRRAKIRYILQRSGIEGDELESFVDSDLENVVELFKTFNQGTHGEAGRFSFNKLQAIRVRVEDGILYLSRLLS